MFFKLDSWFSPYVLRRSRSRLRRFFSCGVLRAMHWIIFAPSLVRKSQLCRRCSIGNAGSEAIELAKGLLSDSQTRVVYQQASNELGGLRELLQLTDKEVAAVSALRPGVALWKVGQRSFLVEHRVSRVERWIIDTEPRAEGEAAGERRAVG